MAVYDDLTSGSLAGSGQSATIGPTRAIVVSLSGTWTGTAKLQRYINGGWRDVANASWTANVETNILVAVTPHLVRLDFNRSTGTLDYMIKSADRSV